MLFLATTSEESGLLGAEHFAADPVVPLPSIVAAFNLDTVAISPRGRPVAILGRGLPPLDSLIVESVSEAKRKLDSDGEADSFITRQDGWELRAKGVPSVMVGGSFSDMAELGAFLSGPYHQPSDDLKRPIELGGAAEDADLLIRIGRKAGDPAKYRPGDVDPAGAQAQRP
jgi:Zn-dependent M28 family amino/carboxypeptidase